MTRKTALLAGTAVLAGWFALTAMAVAQESGKEGQAAHAPGHGSIIERLDLNHDGKITKDEVNKMIAERFSKATGGNATMTEAQFAAIGQNRMQKRTDVMFRRMDWNGDGKVSLSEFTTVQHAMFMRADRDGNGVISCEPHGAKKNGAMKTDDADTNAGHKRAGMHRHHSWRRHGGFGTQIICAQTDLNKDGKVTRGEFDSAIATMFKTNAPDGELTSAAFSEMISAHMKEGAAKRFAQLDKNHDGKLTLAEFSAPEERMFARFDRNKDGAITADELHFHHHGRGHGEKPGADQ